jgi:hypothetical protein
MKKAIQMMAVLMVAAMALFVPTGCEGCASSPLNEQQLASAVPSQIRGQRRVTNVSIDRRQTDGNQDIVYAIITMEDAEVERRAFYRLVINYYNTGGWMVDSWRSYQNAIFSPRTAPRENMALEAAQRAFQGYSLSLVSEDIANWQRGRTSHTFQAVQEANFQTITANAVVATTFSPSNGRWESSATRSNEQRSWNDNMLGSWEVDLSRILGLGFSYAPRSLFLNIVEVTADSLTIEGHFRQERRAVSVREVYETFTQTIEFDSNAEVITFSVPTPTGLTDSWGTRVESSTMRIDSQGIHVRGLEMNRTW